MRFVFVERVTARGGAVNRGFKSDRFSQRVFFSNVTLRSVAEAEISKVAAQAKNLRD